MFKNGNRGPLLNVPLSHILKSFIIDAIERFIIINNTV